VLWAARWGKDLAVASKVLVNKVLVNKVPVNKVVVS
jgi:hypothetical protein